MLPKIEKINKETKNSILYIAVLNLEYVISSGNYFLLTKGYFGEVKINKDFYINTFFALEFLSCLPPPLYLLWQS